MIIEVQSKYLCMHESELRGNIHAIITRVISGKFGMLKLSVIPEGSNIDHLSNVSKWKVSS